MADVVTAQTLVNERDRAVLKFTNVSDGTGESVALKVNVSSLAIGGECRIWGVWYATAGMGVDILWGATVNVLALHIPGDAAGYWDFSAFGGLRNNAGAGKTGNILFTTVGHSSGDRYAIVLDVRKEG